MRSRQFEHQQEASLKRLQAMIPHECPLIVTRDPPVPGFHVQVINSTGEGCRARFQVVAAWIDGYVYAWKAQR